MAIFSKITKKKKFHLLEVLVLKSDSDIAPDNTWYQKKKMVLPIPDNVVN